MNMKLKAIGLLTGAVMLLTACQQRDNNNQVNTQSVPERYTAPPSNDPSVIPSESGHKTRTTNEQMGTTYGLGTSVYSLIGSSSLHSDGFSSHLESRLNGDGVNGVKVFVFDDTVILAASNRQATASQYDPLQQKVLSNTGGQSGMGPEPNSSIGTEGSRGASDDNMVKAEKRIKAMMGGNVRILKAINPKAVETIDRLRANASSSASPQVVSEDLLNLLKLTEAEGSQK